MATDENKNRSIRIIRIFKHKYCHNKISNIFYNQLILNIKFFQNFIKNLSNIIKSMRTFV